MAIIGAIRRSSAYAINVAQTKDTHYHPAVYRIIKYVIDAAHKNNIPCCMCGEAASDPAFIPALIGLGLDEFSMSATKIPEARRIIASVNADDCKKLDAKIALLPSEKEEREFLLDTFKSMISE